MIQHQYETVIILTPVLSDQQLKEAVGNYRELITAEGGQVLHEENWGLTKLAYQIDKKTTGFYFIFEYKAAADFAKKLEIQFKRDEKVMRYLNLRMDKHSIEFNVRRRNGEFIRKVEEPKEIVIKDDIKLKAPVAEEIVTEEATTVEAEAEAVVEAVVEPTTETKAETETNETNETTDK